MSRWDTWWRRIGQVSGGAARIAAFVVGTRIFLAAIHDPHQKPWLYVAGLALMGVPAAGALERLVALASRLLMLLEQPPEKPPEKDEGPGE